MWNLFKGESMKVLKRNMRNALAVVGLIIYGQFGVCSAPAGVVFKTKDIQFPNGVIMTSDQAQEFLKEGKIFPQIHPSGVIRWAADQDRFDLLPLLIKHSVYGKYLNKPHKETGLSPLGFAAVNGRVRSVRILMEGGADQYFRDGQNMTPFLRAAFNGQYDVLRMLCTHAHDRNKMVQANLGPAAQMQNALDLAAQGVSTQTVAFLIQFFKEDSLHVALIYAEAMKEDFAFYKRTNPGVSEADLQKVNEYIIKILKYSIDKKAQESADAVANELKIEEEKEKARQEKIRLNVAKLEQERQVLLEAQKELEAARLQKEQGDLAQEVALKEAQKRTEKALQKEKEQREYDQALLVLKQEMLEREAAQEAQRAAIIKAEKKALYNQKLAAYVQKRDENKRIKQQEDLKKQMDELVNRFAPKDKPVGDDSYFAK